MANKSPRLCIVIPAFNEESAVGSVIKDLHNNFKEYNYDIVVVNDGSIDDTAIVARRSGARIINHIINSGSGAATTTGLSYALIHNYDLAATIDADGQHSAKDLRNVIGHLKNTRLDLVIGSRLINADGMSSVKIAGNKGLSLITYLLFGINVTDSQSGMRAFSRKALESIKLRSTGYEFCSEMLWRAKQQKLKIDEFPIKAIYTDYSKAKGQNNWNGFMIVRSLLSRRIMETFYE